MIVNKTYKTEISVNKSQECNLIKCSGVARFVYNWGLYQKIESRKRGESLPTAFDLEKKLAAIKRTEFPWMYEVSKSIPQNALKDLDLAFAHFFRKCKARKEGKFRGRCGFPKFKSRKNGINGFRLSGWIRFKESNIKLPRMGNVKLKESDYIPLSSKILSATISSTAGRWFVSVNVEEDIPEYANPKDFHSVVGVDLGIKTLAVVSDGTKYANPAALRSNKRRLARLSRTFSRRVKGGRNRQKVKLKISKLHYKITCIRKDSIHKMTTALAKTKQVVVIEDLDVAGMFKNRHLAMSVSDAAFYEIRHQLEYKGLWYGCRIMVANRFFASSKICNVCKAVNKNLKLENRTWTCENCNTLHDRDENAAINLENIAVSLPEI